MSLEKTCTLFGEQFSYKLIADNNILKVNKFEETFYDIFSCTIGSKKFIVEKIDTENGVPIVTFKLTIDGREIVCEAYLIQDKAPGIFLNQKTWLR